MPMWQIRNNERVKIQFHRISNELEHHFSNIKRTWTCLYFDDRTWTPEFRPLNERTSNLKRPLIDLVDYSSNRLEHHFSNIEWTWTCSSFESRTSNGHRTNIEHFILLEKRNFSTFYLLFNSEMILIKFKLTFPHNQ